MLAQVSNIGLQAIEPTDLIFSVLQDETERQMSLVNIDFLSAYTHLINI
jgi:hypothetical protein